MDDMTELRTLGRTLEHAPPSGLSRPEFTGRTRRLRGWPALAVAAALTAATLTVPALLWPTGESAPAVSQTGDGHVAALVERASDPSAWPSADPSDGPQVVVTQADTPDGCAPDATPYRLCREAAHPVADAEGLAGWASVTTSRLPKPGHMRCPGDSADRCDAIEPALLADLVKELRDLASNTAGTDNAAAFRKVHLALFSTLREERTREKLADALALIPGVTTDADAHDWIGRPVTSYAFTTPDGVRQEVFLDAKTAHYLGSRETSAQGKTVYTSAVLKLALADSP
ncbi:hypothetical protein [Actinocorallia sp. A-T 12471]|uniref:hypothetical protein n=1 Tax=Actinocorallia sp. A-T 12471 TaxID=3089813 RepID=UPI0029D06D9E|nr:hypothetical protein [Actinocorallia sp. A-T 12471]MDX6744455.1 hypothetical protein [Actinocorallia sp. A-T 12471]